MSATHPDAAGQGLWFAAKTLNTRSVRRAKSPDEVLGVVLAHNLRAGNEDHRHRGKIDAARTPMNEVLRGASCPQVCVQIAESVFDELQLTPARVDAIMGIELVFQPPPHGDAPTFWTECLRWADGRYQHILSAVVHRDQSRPHMHAVALAVESGALAGNAMSSGANRFAVQRRSFMAHIAAALGMRPNRRKAKAKTLGDLAARAGRGPKTRAAAAKQDAAFERKVIELRMGVGVHGGWGLTRRDPHATDPLNCAAHLARLGRRWQRLPPLGREALAA